MSWVNGGRSGEQEELVQSAVECAHHGATLERADGGEQLLAEIRPDKEPIIAAAGFAESKVRQSSKNAIRCFMDELSRNPVFHLRLSGFNRVIN